MIVGLLFIAIIWCLRGFLSYKQVVHNVVIWALVVCLIYTPSALGPVALVLLVHISGKPLVPMLQLYNIYMLNKNSPGLLKKGAAKQSRIKSIAWNLRWLLRTRADIGLRPSGLVRSRTDIKLQPSELVRSRTNFKLQTVRSVRSY